MALYSPVESRKKRNKETDFDLCNKKDEGEDYKYGQKVRKCVTQADIIIDNTAEWKNREDADSFFNVVKSYLELLDTPNRPPTNEETIMHLAYSISLHSLCLQRQVGAVITDKDYRVLSVGYNSVPHDSDSCFELYSQCYRKIKDKEFFVKLCDKIDYCPHCRAKFVISDDIKNANPASIPNDVFVCKKCKGDLSELLIGKNLDFCRSLHAEENAILSNPLATNGDHSNRELVLFTTTFLCMLCAKKIANSGIRKVIFVEPYPLPESIEILRENGIEIKIFEGVKFLSFNWIFRNRKRYLNDRAVRRLTELNELQREVKYGTVPPV